MSPRGQRNILVIFRYISFAALMEKACKLLVSDCNQGLLSNCEKSVYSAYETIHAEKGACSFEDLWCTALQMSASD